MLPLFFKIPTIKHHICRIILGTASPVYSDPHLAPTLLDKYIELGGNCLDTAPNYLDAELCIAEWINDRNIREDIILSTKAAHHDKNGKRVTPEYIRLDLEESLNRLQTDYIDLYVLHRDDPDQPVGPIIECLSDEQSQKRIRAFGASNWSIPRLEEAANYAAKHGLKNFVISSPQFSLAFPNEPVWPNCLTARDAYSRQWYSRTGMPMFAWSVLGSGFLTERSRLNEKIDMQELTYQNPTEVERVYFSRKNFDRLARVKLLALEKGVSEAQIALACALNQHLNLFAIVAPTTSSEIEELFKAFSIKLSSEALSWLDLERESFQ